LLTDAPCVVALIDPVETSPLVTEREARSPLKQIAPAERKF
jgi:hypothetical protein